MSDVKSLNSKRSNIDLNLKETPKESPLEDKLDELITKHNEFTEKQSSINEKLFEMIENLNKTILTLSKSKENSEIFKELIKEKMGL